AQHAQAIGILEKVKRLPAPADRLVRDEALRHRDPMEVPALGLREARAELRQPGGVVREWTLLKARNDVQRKRSEERDSHWDGVSIGRSGWARKRCLARGVILITRGAASKSSSSSFSFSSSNAGATEAGIARWRPVALERFRERGRERGRRTKNEERTT